MRAKKQKLRQFNQQLFKSVKTSIGGSSFLSGKHGWGRPGFFQTHWKDVRLATTYLVWRERWCPPRTSASQRAWAPRTTPPGRERDTSRPQRSREETKRRTARWAEPYAHPLNTRIKHTYATLCVF